MNNEFIEDISFKAKYSQLERKQIFQKLEGENDGKTIMVLQRGKESKLKILDQKIFIEDKQIKFSQFRKKILSLIQMNDDSRIYFYAEDYCIPKQNQTLQHIHSRNKHIDNFLYLEYTESQRKVTFEIAKQQYLRLKNNRPDKIAILLQKHSQSHISEEEMLTYCLYFCKKTRTLNYIKHHYIKQIKSKRLQANREWLPQPNLFFVSRNENFYLNQNQATIGELYDMYKDEQGILCIRYWQKKPSPCMGRILVVASFILLLMI